MLTVACSKYKKKIDRLLTEVEVNCGQMSGKLE